MEHHSNDLPWRGRCKLEYIEIDSNGRLIISDLEKRISKYNGKVKLITVTGASNVTGYKNDIYKIASIAHSYGAKILVDGAQLVPHVKISMTRDKSIENIDYLVFSGHKMYAPFGCGAIVAPKSDLIEGEPEYKGGGTVMYVTSDEVIWDTPPEKDEAGSPNVIGAVAIDAAIDQLIKLDMTEIEEYEAELMNYAMEKILNIKHVKIYGDHKVENRVGIIPFNVINMHHEEVAKFLSDEGGIAVRSGCFCAHPYVQRILNLSKEQIKFYKDDLIAPRPGLVRVSFGLYNKKSEIDKFIDIINKLK
jgi:selenocysteine lyase/cysteine desulfurase